MFFLQAIFAKSKNCEIVKTKIFLFILSIDVDTWSANEIARSVSRSWVCRPGSSLLSGYVYTQRANEIAPGEPMRLLALWVGAGCADLGPACSLAMSIPGGPMRLLALCVGAGCADLGPACSLAMSIALWVGAGYADLGPACSLAMSIPGEPMRLLALWVGAGCADLGLACSLAAQIQASPPDTPANARN